jgi:replicative DNA helicase
MNEPFPYDSEFQRKIIKLSLHDDGFCGQTLKWITPEMFEADTLRWAWKTIIQERADGRTPTMLVLRDKVRNKVDVVLRPRYGALLDAIDQDVIREEAYIRHALAEFVQRNIVTAAYHASQRLFNDGRLAESIDLLMAESQRAFQITFEVPDRAWFFEELRDRQRQRIHRAEREFEWTFPTGIDLLDVVLDGGLGRGELGTWIADSKGGKSLFLVHLASFTARANRRRTLMVILEGSRFQTENRIEALHAQTVYSDIKRGNMTAETLERLHDEYRQLQGLLVIRGMTSRWNYNVGDIRSELDDLKSQRGWVPDQIVVDYGDLLRSQGRANSEEEHQRNAFSDLKTLTTQDQGYSVWTASQARRPWEGKADKAKKDAKKDAMRMGKPVIRAKDIADSYNKIRRSDFIGSINQDDEDKDNHEARLWADMYRDAPASKLIKIKQDLPKMVFAALLDPLNRPDSPEAIAARAARKEQKQRENVPEGQQQLEGTEAPA